MSRSCGFAYNYRLIHVLFHIRTVIIPRTRYRPEGFSEMEKKSENIDLIEHKLYEWKKCYITYVSMVECNDAGSCELLFRLIKRNAT